MKILKKILSIWMVVFILLSTTGLKAAVHHCMHHFSDNNSAISLSITPLEELCSHHVNELSCCSHSHEGHAADGHCDTHSDCCSTDVAFAQLEIDGIEENPNQNVLNDDFLLSPVFILPSDLVAVPFDSFLHKNVREHQQIPLPLKNELSFLSQYLI